MEAGIDTWTAAREAAESAARLADLDPRRAGSVAAVAVGVAERADDHVSAATAERAWGHSLVQCGRLDTAIRHFHRSMSHGRLAGSADLVGEARIRLAYALIMRGRPRAALDEIDVALGELTGAAAVRARAQRGAILLEIGRFDEALVELSTALPALRRAADRVGTARALVNRGIVQAWLHDFSAATRDFRESERVSRSLGRGLAVGIVTQNLGFVAALRGDVPAGLAHFAAAERMIAENGGQIAAVLQDHGELLLSVGVTSEARELAERAIAASRGERRQLKVPELRLVLAQVAFLEQDWDRSRLEADRALRGFVRQQRAEWAALARLAGYRARLADGSPGRLDRTRIEAMVRTLAASGWLGAEVEARLVAAHVLVAGKRWAEGRQHLRLAGRVRRRGPAALRARGWYAEAMRRETGGDPRRAAIAVRAGLRVLDEHAAALGATDVRVHSAAYRSDLCAMGLRMALRAGRPAGVLEWAERGRASQLTHRPVLPTEDHELADLLAQLRATAAEIDKGRGGLGVRQQGLEKRIRDHCRIRPPRSGWRLAPPVDVPTLGKALGDRALVEFVEWGGALQVLTLVERRLRLHALGSVSRVAGLVRRLPFALRRLVATGPTQQAAHVLLRDTAVRLDEMLLDPLPELEKRPLVVVPTGVLHGMPWSVLPSCAGRPVTVAPSVTLWHKASEDSREHRRSVAVAGDPGLPGARDEARAVAEIHGCEPLLDESATTDRVLAELAEAGIAHLAAHGGLATDNPLFSTLRLHDGPLVAYDLERLGTVPHTVVLASCESGRSVVHTGDELLGLSASFIARGAVQLVASVVPIPDAETAPLMVALHRGIAAGMPAPVALAAAQLETRNPGELAAAAGFVSIGGELVTAAMTPAGAACSTNAREPAATAGSVRG